MRKARASASQCWVNFRSRKAIEDAGVPSSPARDTEHQIIERVLVGLSLATGLKEEGIRTMRDAVPNSSEAASKFRSTSRIFMIVVPLMVLAACASSEKKWVRSEAPITPADSDMAQCKFQAASATASMASDSSARRREEASLINSCMQAKGYKQ